MVHLRAHHPPCRRSYHLQDKEEWQPLSSNTAHQPSPAKRETKARREISTNCNKMKK
jgi:hypothetical protein